MIGPLLAHGFFGLQGALVMAFVVGISFGFILERVGFSSARKLVSVFYLRDMAVLKTIFIAIVTAMLGLIYLHRLGLLQWDQVNIEPTYLWPQIAGGILFGVGFVLGGYCPGTCIVAAVSGKLDALAFIAGALAGIGLFGAGYPVLQRFYLSGSLGVKTLPAVLHIPEGIMALLVVLMALGAFWGSEKVEALFAPKAVKEGAPQ